MLAVLRTVAVDIKLAHSVFALPFACLAAIMAGAPAGATIEWPRLAGQLGLVVVAMVFARTVAMLANRLLDRKIDARNPRTAGRAIPAGRITTGAAMGVMGLSTAGFVIVCGLFGVVYGNWWPLVLSMPVLAWISAYGLFKRFTALCHLFLGSSLAISPIAAAIAVDPSALNQPSLWLLSAMVLFWVAGFDIIYALQDVDVDRDEGLHSIPAALGPAGARRLAAALHVVATGCLVGACSIDARFGVVFGIGVAMVIALLAWEHATVARWGTTKLALAFFTLNGVISCVLGGLGIVDILV
ncbi:MAG: UbiA-like polyprenyltransferase [Planctomycetota bacterium]|jgi:4-hydroxybenzoate polyprenyltransferase